MKKRYRGRPPTTLPDVIHKDLVQIKLNLKSFDDLNQLRKLAADRSAWRNEVIKTLCPDQRSKIGGCES